MLGAGWSGSDVAPLTCLVFGWGDGGGATGQRGDVNLIIKQARLLHLAAGLQKEQEKPSPSAGTLFKPLLCHVSFCPLDQSKSHSYALMGGVGEKRGSIF